MQEENRASNRTTAGDPRACDQKAQRPEHLDRLTEGSNGQGLMSGPGQELIIEQVLRELFRYHQPTQQQLPRYQAVRTEMKNCAEVIVQNTQDCEDRKQAILHLRLAMMLANSAIALGGLSL